VVNLVFTHELQLAILVALVKADGRWTHAASWGKVDLSILRSDPKTAYWFLNSFYRHAKGFLGWGMDLLPKSLEYIPDQALRGVVRVAAWRHVPTSVAGRYLHRYRSKSGSDGAGHNHVHGANMGFLAEKYWKVGGFAALPSGEDVDLVRRFEQSGFHIRRDANLSVVTSARHDGRAPNGFAAHLRSMLHRRGAEDLA
jgi:hypothetical protein